MDPKKELAIARRPAVELHAPHRRRSNIIVTAAQRSTEFRFHLTDESRTLELPVLRNERSLPATEPARKSLLAELTESSGERDSLKDILFCEDPKESLEVSDEGPPRNAGLLGVGVTIVVVGCSMPLRPVIGLPGSPLECLRRWREVLCCEVRRNEATSERQEEGGGEAAAGLEPEETIVSSLRNMFVHYGWTTYKIDWRIPRIQSGPGGEKWVTARRATAVETPDSGPPARPPCKTRK